MDKQRDVYNDDELLGLVGDLNGFIVDQVISYRGDYHDRNSELGCNLRYQHLRETQALTRTLITIWNGLDLSNYLNL
jgi:hypothetical protein